MTELEYRDLRKKSLDELRDMASQYTEGVALLKKEQLIELLCTELGIKKKVQAEGVDIPAIKQQIRALKVKRQEFLEGKDGVHLKRTRRKIRALKRRIRKGVVEATRHAGH
jgi:hypothetical protein